ncbi:MAG: 50S ribosomal protein L23 [Parcubacteria group bacterium SW_6_46_9]|nr:MAG: 50S ribosomal protein L23 [Parcubacteria group bacterium SW_6_46_9]
MALFSSDTDENETNADTQSGKQSSENNQSSYRNDGKPAQRIDNSRSEVLVRPYITEKATYLTDDGVYTFVVKEDAHKPQIKRAVKDVYGVSVDKVRTAKLPKKQVESRAGQTGTKGGGKKAYVHLKEGDSIELM